MKLIRYLFLLFLIPINYGYAEYTPSILTPDSLDYRLYENLINFIDSIPVFYTAAKEFVFQSNENSPYGDTQEFKADYSFGKVKLGNENISPQLTVDSQGYFPDFGGYGGNSATAAPDPQSVQLHL